MADLEARLTALAERVTKTEDRLDDHDDRLNNLSEKQAEQGATLKATADNAKLAADRTYQILWGLFLIVAGMAAQFLYMILRGV